ncbi:hypothetical protein NliqN6_5284 [Naganishia liquefaciens]|uniref:Zn(2)-C6 fungal-type domain-containing protein n=1 Tax=Naganishia liquefaciens TaxID=104408 RepID=A0A8H3TXD6_9TREE|nr:hypothetical protein NliqN6_5284 [Naganishia liquefaciens]
MNPNTSTLQPRGGPLSLEHKTSSTSIRSLLNEPVLDPQLQPTDRRPLEDPSRLTPTRDQRPYTSEETPRQASDFPRGPSSGAYHTTAQSRYREQDRKLSEGGSEGEGSSCESMGPKRPRSTVSDTSSRFEYPFPTPASTASITLQQAYHGAPPPIVPDMYSTMPSKAIQSTGSSRAPISRATKACNACRSRKVRCDAGGSKSSAAGEELPCTRCKDSGIQCVYTGSQRKRGPAPGANRPGQRRKPSSLELDLRPTLGLAVPPDMSRTRSASSITAGNGHYHPYAQPGSLPSPPSAYRIASRPGNEFPPYPTTERFDYGRPAPLSYDRPFTGVPRTPLTAPLTGHPPRDYEYRHSISGEVPHPRSQPAYGYPPQDPLARQPPPPPTGAHPAYPGARQTYPNVDPSLQAESQRPSTALSGWQGGGAPSPSLRAPLEQQPSRHHDAAAYQAGYEAALRETRIAAKVEAQHQEQDRRDRERQWERERMMQAEREGKAVPASAPPPRGFEEPNRPPYWERSDLRDVKVDERISVEERERLQRRDAEIAAASREHRLPEMNARVTLPPIQQMDRSLAL